MSALLPELPIDFPALIKNMIFSASVDSIKSCFIAQKIGLRITISSYFSRVLYVLIITPSHHLDSFLRSKIVRFAYIILGV